MSKFVAVASYRPTPELIYQLFSKFHNNPHLQVLAQSVSESVS